MTNKELNHIEKYFPEDTNFIFEGININYTKKLVSVDLTHENGVDTSIINNPIITYIGDIKVISIFKRKKYEDSDSNPLLYALKKINGWTINQQNVDILINQFNQIINKIVPNYHTVIKVPSSNELNNIFLDKLNDVLKCDNKIYDFIHKLDCDMIWEDGIDFVNMSVTDNLLMKKCFAKMNGEFTFKHIKPVSLRKFIKKIYNDNLIDNQLDFAHQINDKDILILDDTVTTGATISLFIDAINYTYTPKSITVITLFSSLQDQ